GRREILARSRRCDVPFRSCQFLPFDPYPRFVRATGAAVAPSPWQDQRLETDENGGYGRRTNEHQAVRNEMPKLNSIAVRRDSQRRHAGILKPNRDRGLMSSRRPLRFLEGAM